MTGRPRRFVDRLCEIGASPLTIAAAEGRNLADGQRLRLAALSAAVGYTARGRREFTAAEVVVIAQCFEDYLRSPQTPSEPHQVTCLPARLGDPLHLVICSCGASWEGPFSSVKAGVDEHLRQHA